MRISSATLVVILGGCSEAGFDAEAVAHGDRALACAIGDGSEFGSDCTLDRRERDGVEIYVAHHPGGGFRRFVLAADGSGLEAMDGADTARNRLSDGMLEVTVGADRYRFPTRPGPVDDAK